MLGSDSLQNKGQTKRENAGGQGGYNDNSNDNNY